MSSIPMFDDLEDFEDSEDSEIEVHYQDYKKLLEMSKMHVAAKKIQKFWMVTRKKLRSTALSGNMNDC